MRKMRVLFAVILALFCLTICHAEGKTVSVGDIITFGSYEQNHPNEMDPIEWIVLDVDVDTNRALVISRYALDAQPYNEELTDVSWEQCTLRTWLNDTFLNAAFTDTEQKAIDDPSVNADTGTVIIGGGHKQDRIFLFIYTEYITYFHWDDNLIHCAPTDYAIANGVYQNNKDVEIDDRATCWWWLMVTSYSKQGMVVSYNGEANGAYVDDKAVGIRPAMWIKLDSFPF